jgi:uncharacterized membrane protein
MQQNGDFLPEEDAGPNKEERMLGVICYAPFGFMAPIMTQKQSDFLTFHTKQGGVIFGIYFFLVIIPISGLFGILTLAYIGIASFAGWKAYNGEMYTYEFIDKLFQNFKK